MTKSKLIMKEKEKINENLDKEEIDKILIHKN